MKHNAPNVRTCGTPKCERIISGPIEIKLGGESVLTLDACGPCADRILDLLCMVRGKSARVAK